MVFFSELERLVSSDFKVKESFLYLGVPVFHLEENQDFEDGIRRIRDKLKSENLIPILRREAGQIVLRIHGGLPPSTTGPRRKWLDKLPIILFIATIISVTYSGYGHSMGYLSMLKLLGRLKSDEQVFLITFISLYTISVMCVVGLHELGHLISSRKHKTKASLPFFIPGPPPFGSFGAVIRQEAPILNKKELFDLGLAGPISGFVVSLIISFLGLPLSALVNPEELAFITSTIETTSISVPVSWLVMDSLFFNGQFFLTRSPDSGLFINPVAFAAWAGLFITFLNIFPIGQLDGGHVSYALFGPKYHRYISYGAALVMALIGFWPMALLSILTLRAGSPVMLDTITELDTKRKLASLIMPIMLVLSFSLF
ncbi:MAG: site-2 protease family protein [Candidatus Bathyarchaeota archaeon]|nr:MAG: site-2 protease family protein [Candidatus Bathyarchaeota archaeon]